MPAGISSTERRNVARLPARAVDIEADENIASLIAVLQDQLALAREGKLRSVAVVSVAADGGAVGTQWSCANGDIVSLIGKLTVLTHDLMASRE
ncbi:hypothetical protein [Methylobacterium durans]|uniref:hypothetical protein n=1 Tax=Methylobacterium durans TaxID=2202825 RepID=UPI001F3D77E0|nr:hypothetical protein [Methylobacterium durans]